MTYDVNYEHSQWFDNIFHPEKLKTLTNKAIPKLRRFRKQNPFDAMAFTGLSGALFATILSGRLQIPLIMVRKKNDRMGAGGEKKPVCGFKNFKRYIIIDDLIGTGATLKVIHKAVTDFSKWEPELVGVALYDKHNYAGVPKIELIPSYNSPTKKELPIIRLWKF